MPSASKACRPGPPAAPGGAGTSRAQGRRAGTLGDRVLGDGHSDPAVRAGANSRREASCFVFDYAQLCFNFKEE